MTASSSLPRLVARLRDFLLAFGVIAVTTVILFLLRERFSTSTVALLYLVLTLFFSRVAAYIERKADVGR